MRTSETSLLTENKVFLKRPCLKLPHTQYRAPYALLIERSSPPRQLCMVVSRGAEVRRGRGEFISPAPLLPCSPALLPASTQYF
jgi:hypothetical protein